MLRHLLHMHNITNLEDYYKKYYTFDNKCVRCSQPTKFSGTLEKGYRKYCCNKCQTKHNAEKNIGTHHSEETKIKISEKRIAYLTTKKGRKDLHNLSINRRGLNNPVHRQTAETKKASKLKQSNTMKEKIKNGSFTPPITNSWANSKTKLYIEGKKYWFRSTWEAVFFMLNPHLLYEKTRIQYTDANNNNKIYIVDFTDNKKKILYEVKPAATVNNINNIYKQRAALNWCKQNNYKYVIVSNSYFIKNAKKINYNNIDPKIKKGMLQFL